MSSNPLLQTRELIQSAYSIPTQTRFRLSRCDKLSSCNSVPVETVHVDGVVERDLTVSRRPRGEHDDYYSERSLEAIDFPQLR